MEVHGLFPLTSTNFMAYLIYYKPYYLGTWKLDKLLKCKSLKEIKVITFTAISSHKVMNVKLELSIWKQDFTTSIDKHVDLVLQNSEWYSPFINLSGFLDKILFYFNEFIETC